MTLASYYRRTLLLPVAVSLLLLPVLLFADRLSTAGAVLLVGVVAAPGFASPAYFVFVLLALRWMPGKPERRLRRTALLAPLLFAPVSAAWFLGAVWSQRGSFWSAAEATFGAFVPFGIVLGYAYVAIAEAGRVALTRRGRIEREAA